MTKGYFVDEKGRVFIIENGETMTKDEFAQRLVDESNNKIQIYNEAFAKGAGKDTFNMSDWFRYNEGLMPYIREAADLVHSLHEKGYTQYKINMQSGIIN